jgi:hypothetical protein
LAFFVRTHFTLFPFSGNMKKIDIGSALYLRAFPQPVTTGNTNSIEFAFANMNQVPEHKQ